MGKGLDAFFRCFSLDFFGPLLSFSFLPFSFFFKMFYFRIQESIIL